MPIRRGEIRYADLSPVRGSEQGGERPVLVLSNDTANENSPTVIVAAMTGREKKLDLPTHIRVYPAQSGLRRTSVILLEQLRTVDRSRLGRKIGLLPKDLMKKVEAALLISLGIL